METNDNKSIVKQFLKEVGLTESPESNYYSRGIAEDWIQSVPQHTFQKFCNELELLLDMKECVYSHLKQMEDGADKTGMG